VIGRVEADLEVMGDLPFERSSSAFWIGNEPGYPVTISRRGPVTGHSCSCANLVLDFEIRNPTRQSRAKIQTAPIYPFWKLLIIRIAGDPLEALNW
jgi:hypothetical protein